MPRASLGLYAALAALATLGCGAAPPVPVAAEEGLPLVIPAPARASVVEPEPEPPDPAEAPAPCALAWAPHDLGASVVSIPAARAGRMMRPLYAAICACTRPGQSVQVLARLVPERGAITAVTADSPDAHARSSARIDACLAQHLGAGRFEPFVVGSDNVCPPDPAGCARPGGGVTTLSYPVQADRRGEAHR